MKIVVQIERINLNNGEKIKKCAINGGYEAVFNCFI